MGGQHGEAPRRAAKNRRVGMILFAVFLGLAIMSVVFVLLRKYG